MKSILAILAVLAFGAFAYPTKSVPTVIAETNRALPLVTTAAMINAVAPVTDRCYFVEMNW